MIKLNLSEHNNLAKGLKSLLFAVGDVVVMEADNNKADRPTIYFPNLSSNFSYISCSWHKEMFFKESTEIWNSAGGETFNAPDPLAAKYSFDDENMQKKI